MEGREEGGYLGVGGVAGGVRDAGLGFGFRGGGGEVDDPLRGRGDGRVHCWRGWAENWERWMERGGRSLEDDGSMVSLARRAGAESWQAQRQVTPLGWTVDDHLDSFRL